MSKLIRLGTVLVILALSFFVLTRSSTDMAQPFAPASASVPAPGTARITFPDGFVMTAGLARTNAEQRQGLSGRASLKEQEGLLFPYAKPTVPSYWMKDMLIPIDILWIHGQTLVGFEQKAQPENPPTTFYTPKAAVDRVLEVSSGFVEKHHLKEGDTLDIVISNQ